MKWLNEHSKNFLSRGYLTEGVTPEERVRFIADKAEEILEIEGFADKFYGYMEKGYYSMSSPIWSNSESAKDFNQLLWITPHRQYGRDTLHTSEVGMMSKFGGGPLATSATYVPAAPKSPTTDNHQEPSTL